MTPSARISSTSRARPTRSRRGARGRVKQKIRPVVQRILDQIAAPATVRNARLDYLGANALGRALYAPVFDSREQPVNSARFTFLDPAAADFYPEWDRVATELVAHLRSEAGRNPYDRQLSDLIGELSTRSDEFRVRWAAHNVRFHRTGTKQIHHPVVGDLDLVYESMELSADDAEHRDLHRRARLGDPAGTRPARQLDGDAGRGRRAARDRRARRALAASDGRPAARQLRHERKCDRWPRSTVPALKLNNGVEMPALGLGVFQTPPDETRDAVRAALDAGYRHIDTAAAYGNEREVGEAIAASGLDRSEVFVETKIWISDFGYDETLHGFEKSARKLGVEQIDLLILHQALPSAFDRTLEAYRALETLLADGKVRAIGVSNFMVEHLERLLDRASVVPAVNQIEQHPYFSQADVQAFGEQHGILAQAWSPIGGITFYRDSGHSIGAPGPGHRPDRASARQEPGPGHAPVGHPARTLGHPEVHQARRGSPRTSTSSTSSSPPTR